MVLLKPHVLSRIWALYNRLGYEKTSILFKENVFHTHFNIFGKQTNLWQKQNFQLTAFFGFFGFLWFKKGCTSLCELDNTT